MQKLELGRTNFVLKGRQEGAGRRLEAQCSLWWAIKAFVTDFRPVCSFSTYRKENSIARRGDQRAAKFAGQCFCSVG